MVPEEAWTGRKIWEYSGQGRLPMFQRKKWSPKSKETIMVGYCEDSKAYCVINPGNPCNVQKERNVMFIENYECPTRD
jgi:hypothetical protein